MSYRCGAALPVAAALSAAAGSCAARCPRVDLEFAPGFTVPTILRYTDRRVADSAKVRRDLAWRDT
jgi:hypothetical protein